MGTKLGNLHIRNATVEEVAPLLPGAIVGQWADGFVSAYSEEYQWGSTEHAGKKLSRKLPAATVFAAAIFDSDVVSFEVYQAGKRLTAHLLNPYEDINRAGNPKVFCEALGLPPEDEKRLRTLWKKGDAEEQLELTGALLGLPLCHDPAFMPKEPARRDVAAVDAWIAERPDPPKTARIKSVTKAELVQEISEVVKPKRMGDHFFALSTVSGIKEEKETFGISLHIYVWYLISHESLYRLNDDGLLDLVIQRERPGEAFCVDAGSLEKTEFRSAGENRIIELHMTEAPEAPFHWKVTWDSEGLAVGEAGDSYKYGAFYEPMRPPFRSSSLSPDGSTLFTVKRRYVLQLIDTKTEKVRREFNAPTSHFGACADAFGRFWSQRDDGMIEGYDDNLQLVSRHRLKGDLISLQTNAKGELMAYTYDCAYKSDDRTLRVYRIS